MFLLTRCLTAGGGSGGTVDGGGSGGAVTATDAAYTDSIGSTADTSVLLILKQ